MVIMTPSDENETRQLLHTGLEFQGPAAVRYPRGTGPGADIQQQLQALPIGPCRWAAPAAGAGCPRPGPPLGAPPPAAARRGAAAAGTRRGPGHCAARGPDGAGEARRLVHM